MPGCSNASRYGCPFCGEQIDSSSEFITTERMFGMGGTFRYGVCETCKSFRLSNPPVKLADYYPADEYYSFVSPSRRWDSILHRIRAFVDFSTTRASGLGLPTPARLQPPWSSWYLASEMSPSSSVLDVGCGDGKKLRRLVASKSVRSAAGYDPFYEGPNPSEFVIHRDALADIEGEFSAIIFNHSLEHLLDPLETLRAASSLLEPNGRVIIRVPLTDSVAADAFGSYWSELDAPRHISLPSSAGIVLLAERAEMEVIRSYRDGTAIEIADSLAYAAGVNRRDPSYSEFTSSVRTPSLRIVSRLNALDVGGRGTFILGR